MSGWTIDEQYFSGQGSVLVAKRDPVTGKPKGFRAIGNCPALTLGIETTTIDHKESTSGQRATDLRLTTETKLTVNFTLENFKSANLADSMRGVATLVPGASVTALALVGYPGMITALGRIRVSAVAVKKGATALTAFVDDLTPYDYKINLDAGSIQINDGTKTAQANIADTITAITVGTTTSLAIATSGLVAGDVALVSGLGGADAASLNGKYFTVLSKTSSAVVLAVDTTGKTITASSGSPRATGGAIALLVDYTFADQYQVDALTLGATELYLRFEGLNTANLADSNSPVVVEVFRFQTDPLKELALIGDTVNQFGLEGSCLADNTRSTGSKFFNVQKIG